MASSVSVQVVQEAPCPERPCAPSSSSSSPSGGVIVAVDGFSFATDLLFNVEDVRARCASGVATQSALLQLLRGRINLEREYAAELSKMAQRSTLEQQEDAGAFKDALAALRAQYINTGVQHRLLADNLKEDVLDPLERFHMYAFQKLQHLTKLAGVIKKQTKTNMDVYKKEFAAFEKLFRDASAAFATAMDRGISSTMIEREYHDLLAQLPSVEPASGDEAPSDPPRSRQKSIVAMQTINNNSQKLVNWLLSSDQQRKESASGTVIQSIEAAEMARRKCQRAWQHAEQSLVNMYQTTQSVLTAYQHIAEQKVSTLTTNIQKHVVFESSALANLQYDWQMLASKLENIPPEADILQSIRTYGGKPELGDMTVRDLWSDALQSLTSTPTTKQCRPLKQCPLQVRDLARRKLPFDTIGSRKPLREVLVVRHLVCPIAPASIENRSIDLTKNPRCLKIDTRSSDPTKPNDGRVIVARDVARAIARAYELHAVDCGHTKYEAKTLLQCSEPQDFGLDVTAATVFADPSEISENEPFAVGTSNNKPAQVCDAGTPEPAI